MASTYALRVLKAWTIYADAFSYSFVGEVRRGTSRWGLGCRGREREGSRSYLVEFAGLGHQLDDVVEFAGGHFVGFRSFGSLVVVVCCGGVGGGVGDLLGDVRLYVCMYV